MEKALDLELGCGFKFININIIKIEVLENQSPHARRVK